MPIRRRRPVLRAAAVGGGAYYMGRRRAESEARQADAVQPAGPQAAGSVQPPIPQAAASVPPAPDQARAGASGQGVTPDDLQRLQELAELRDRGVLTDEELAIQKARILG
jgi:Short C-terminal domain